MANVGDYVEFGNYPQTANADIKTIEWQIQAKENNKMLVISKYGLEARRFASSSKNWKHSEIRKWLNGDFYNKAFNEKEKTYIEPFETFSGVLDNVFLLSKEEVEKYFVYDDARKCKATEYAVKNGAYVADNACSWWWLRSPFLSRNRHVYNVSTNGYSNRSNYVYGTHILVRPALCINL